jgi:hypothetical protein
MIISVWKPIIKKSKVLHYDVVDKTCLLVKKGTTNYKVIWICDDPNCRTPTVTHSISACHLIKEKMCYDTQICRPCQCTGIGNGRYGDRRKWVDFFDEKKINELKNEYSNKWKGELNPSKIDNVKVKKNQAIINETYIENICKEKNFSLVDIIKIDGKRSEFTIKCNNDHISNKKYLNFTRKNKIFNCARCYYNSIGLMLSDEELLKYENYKKQVRALTAKTYRLHKEYINPDNLVNGKNDYHIDHKYSVVEGFKNNISVNIISSKENLEMLKSNDNLSKQGRCSITLNELLSITSYL